ncbi:1-acyl-sn-glycerol-3-phosphate acyltransferase [bacterium]|nr:1-acyl-sn-glycerol-3-phosphate acyltransferase [bacterium]
MIRYIISVIIATTAILLCYLWYPIYILSGKRAGMLFIRTFFSTLLKANNITVKMSGLEHIDLEQNYLILSNHQSIFDIPIVSASLPLDIRIFAKQELIHIPLFGWGMWLYDFVFVNRKKKKDAMLSLHRAADTLNNFSFLVFPEGTRSKDGRVHSFKTGAIEIARLSGKPVLLVAVRGSGNIMKKDSLFVSGGSIEIQIFPPEMVAKNDNRKERAKEFQKIIASFVE